MEVAVGSATSLLGKVCTTLSDGLVAAYVDSLQLGQNSEQIRDKLLHTQGLLHNAQLVSDNPGLQRLLEKLSRDADHAEDLLDEVHYFQIHDRLHGTNYATTQEAGPDLDSLVRHQALHAGSALRHTLTSLLHCFSCSSSTPKVKRDAAAADDDGAVAGVGGNGGAAAAVASVAAAAAAAGVTNSNSASADDDVDTVLHFDRVSMSREIKSEFHFNIRNVGKMKHLQELKEFHVRKESMGFELTELGALTELEGGLVIRGLEHVVTKEEATAAKLMLKRNLEELELLWGRTTDSDILDALRPHPNLRALRIANHGGTILGEVKHDYEERVMQLSSSSSLQKLSFRGCKGLVLVPAEKEKEKENGGGIEEDNSLLQSLTISGCGKLLCRWPSMGMGESADTIIYPFPASLRKLYLQAEASIKSMAVLSNLTSLTSLSLKYCRNLTVDGFNPLIAVNLINLEVQCGKTLAADMLSQVASHSHSQRAKLLPAESYMSRLEVLSVDDISGLLVAPICNLLASALHTLGFNSDKRTEGLTEEQEKALQLLTSLRTLAFIKCKTQDCCNVSATCMIGISLQVESAGQIWAFAT
ncbi:hypothetical protein ZWY2020_019602 [Hordeum vulgare]|nr:hypothetical protein ZWY2020_019602 [Hordeum vulgare]